MQEQDNELSCEIINEYEQIKININAPHYMQNNGWTCNFNCIAYIVKLKSHHPALL